MAIGSVRAPASQQARRGEANGIRTKQHLQMADDTSDSIVICPENLPAVAALIGVNSGALRKMMHRHGGARAALGELALRMLPARGGEYA
jgi:hypothetical protein